MSDEFIPQNLQDAWDRIDPSLKGDELEKARQEAEQKQEEARQLLAEQQKASEGKLTPEQLAARNDRMERSDKTTADIFVTINEKGIHYPNASLAGQQLLPDNVSPGKGSTEALANALKSYAEEILAGKDKTDIEQNAKIERIDAVCNLLELVPEGIKFTPEGRPDLTPFSMRQESIEQGLNGDYKHDAKLANIAAGISNEEWDVLKQEYVWHHAGDNVMQLIPKDIHNLVNHVGSANDIRVGVVMPVEYQQVIREAIERQNELLKAEAAFKEQTHQDALARGASEENAQKSAEERTQLMIEQRALDAEQAKLTAHDKREAFTAVMQKQEDLRDAKAAQEKAEAAREGRKHDGPGPLGEFERSAKISGDALELKTNLDLEWKITTFKYSKQDADHYRREREEYVKRTREEEQRNAARRQYEKDHDIVPPPPPSYSYSHGP